MSILLNLQRLQTELILKKPSMLTYSPPLDGLEIVLVHPLQLFDLLVHLVLHDLGHLQQLLTQHGPHIYITRHVLYR